MGEINESRKPGRRKKSVRVDLTPMVDLGFILITFFIFTTSMSEPKSMKLLLPADSPDDSMQTAESKTLNLVLAERNTVAYYYGKEIAQMKTLPFNQVRAIIQEHKIRVQQQFGNGREQVLLIKATDKCNYGNVVDVLDEVIINAVGRYVLMEPSAEEALKAEQRP